MGWGDCGYDSNGRAIGYHFVATCDHPECEATIDRGLAYACGGMHGSDECSCERYFCSDHMTWVQFNEFSGMVCLDCAAVVEATKKQEESVHEAAASREGGSREA